MRLGTKILLLTLAATVGLSGTVIYLVTREVTAREIDRARHTIKWAVSGYFQSVEEPTHVYFVGYRVDDHWLNKLLHLVREDVTRREESLGVISAWFVVDGKVIARATSSGDSSAALPDHAAALVTASSKSHAAEQ